MSTIQTYLVYLLIILLSISIGMNVLYHYQKVALKADQTSLKHNIDQLKQDISVRDSKIKDQNKQISDAAQKSLNDKASIDNLGKTIEKQNQENKDLIDKLLHQPAPKTCDDAAKYLKDNIGIYQW